MLTRLGDQARVRIKEITLWTNEYGIARTILALGTAATLAFNSSSTLFRAHGDLAALNCRGLTAASLFCLIPTNRLDLARWLAVFVLFAVASGWHPRWTGIIHWWVAWSFYWSAAVSDGGDRITAILTLFLVPITLVDHRRWHWQNATIGFDHEKWPRVIILAALLLIRVQVAVVYLDAVLGKLGVRAWTDGSALYYILQDPTFGASSWLVPLVNLLRMSPLIVLVLTWGALILESCLFASYFLPARYGPLLLLFGVLLHLAMAILTGVVSFSIAMIGALILYLPPPGRVFWSRFTTTYS